MMQAGTVSQRAPALLDVAPPRLLVEWEPRWHAFQTSIRPALLRATRPLAGEIVAGAKPGRGSVASLLIHAVCMAAIFSVTTRVLHEQALLRPQSNEQNNTKVLYYAGHELPSVEGDASGLRAGLSGRSGGREAFHPTQVIRVARGDQATEQVADVARLRLPVNNGAVANLVALQQGALPAVPIQSIRSSRAVALEVPAVAPAPLAQDMRSRSPQMFATEIVAPAPDAAEIASLRRSPRLTRDAVPPPVSAPARDVNSLARLTLPAQVVQPATEISEIPVHGARLARGQVAVVAPPTDVAETGVNRRTYSLNGRGTAVAPPAVDVGAGSLGGNPSGRGKAALALASRGTSVVGPPADPGPDKVGLRSGRGTVVAESDSPSAGISSGTSGVTGVVVSANPGSGVGAPSGAGDGSIAMSPRGSGTTGFGGSGTGHSVGEGSGTGSATTGFGPGATTAGTGHGADPNATNGIAIGAGPGGSGSGSGGFMSGITVTGGGTVYNIPSFSGSPAPSPGSIRMADNQPRQSPRITVVASARSGSALHEYGVLKGSHVYTIYIDTAIGTAVMEFSEQQSSGPSFETDLTSPEPMRAVLPTGIPKERVVISCTIDRSGTLRHLHVMNPRDSAAERQLLVALGNWRFRPVLKGNDAVEVDAIVGFGIDTR